MMQEESNEDTVDWVKKNMLTNRQFSNILIFLNSMQHFFVIQDDNVKIFDILKSLCTFTIKYHDYYTHTTQQNSRAVMFTIHCQMLKQNHHPFQAAAALILPQLPPQINF